ncbi:MAG TPA: type I-E CRISPR-associated protein Cse2/CasB [Ruminococcus sp.]|nr:type I-E CRISPR-associated protein Cse2/CasB [Ruminococcus sp.]HBN11939.1 type I-E CRISPR-associated protein Cse2/CasB [Ruminococcus sp.]
MESKSEMIVSHMMKCITSLIAIKDTGRGKAMLAKLRRGIGKTPGELPELWGVFLNEMPEQLLGKNGVPSRAEWAVYLSLTMFALHQQGNAEVVHVKNISLGDAARMLAFKYADDGRERVIRRFAPVITAKDMPEFAHYLRSMIQLFKSEGIGLDYVKLAKDIYYFQSDRKKVQLSWGESFYYEKGEK